jgi:hypothetical protein
MMTVSEKFDVPVLEGYTSLPVAGEQLNVSRQRIFQMALEEGKFPSVRAIPGTGERPAAYVVLTTEVDTMVEAQAAASAAKAAPPVPAAATAG